MTQSLFDTRLAAAEATSGGSSEPVYTIFESEAARRNLSGRVLDYGAGTAVFSRRLLVGERFEHVVAADIQDRPPGLDPAVTWIRADLNEPFPAGEGEFDAVMAPEVIEHLENPRSVVRDWYRLLRPGGTLLYSTPNNESWRSLLSLAVRGHFYEFVGPAYPAHISALVRADHERITQEAGFDSVHFVFTDFGRMPKLTSRTWQSLSPRLRGLRYSDNVLVVARKPHDNLQKSERLTMNRK